MDAQLIYDARSDVLHAGGSAAEEAIAVPLRELVILLSPAGEVVGIDVVDFTGFARKYLRPGTKLAGERLFAEVHTDLQRLLAPWFANIGPLAADLAEKLDALQPRE